ncbi:MAG: hypothetical protein Q8Q97_01060, partial [bacterium]|nr:hypothetical protein [bacterium]
MATLNQSVAKTAELATDITAALAKGAIKKVPPMFKAYMKLMATILGLEIVIVPFLFALKIETGETVFAEIGAFLAVSLTLVFLFLWTPIGVAIGMMLGKTANPAEGGERYVKFAASVVFLELIASAFVIRMPLHHNTDGASALIVSMMALALASLIWGSWISGRACAVISLALSAFLFAFPNITEGIWDVKNQIDTTVGNVIKSRDPNVLYLDGGRTRVHPDLNIQLRANIWSDEFSMSAGNYFLILPGKKLEYAYAGAVFKIDTTVRTRTLVARNGEITRVPLSEPAMPGMALS